MSSSHPKPASGRVSDSIGNTTHLIKRSNFSEEEDDSLRKRWYGRVLVVLHRGFDEIWVACSEPRLKITQIYEFSGLKQPRNLCLLAATRIFWVARLSLSVFSLFPFLPHSLSSFQFNKGFVKTELSECAVCLSDFQGEEKLRSITNCGHVFHIDCIDVWLQSNANCPLYRRSISVPPRFGFAFEQSRIVAPATSPQDPDPYRTRSNQGNGDEDYVVIELGEVNRDPENPFVESVFRRRERLGSVDLPSSLLSISISPFRVKRKKSRKLDHVLSMGDVCIDVNRVKDEQFSTIQPIRRSFSLDFQ